MINIDPNPPEKNMDVSNSYDITPVEFTTNPMSYKYKKTGCDDRYPLFDQDPNRTDIIYNLSIHIRKQDLLTFLKNKDISIYDKISRIEAEMEMGSTIAPNRKAGGLFTDWERDI